MSTTNEANQYRLEEHHYLISRTDLASRICYVNQTFIEVSGYSEAESLGASSELFRHPDMPAPVFDDIWTTLKAGHICHAVAQMDQATQRNVVYVEQLSTTAAELSGQAGVLRSTVAVFYC